MRLVEERMRQTIKAQIIGEYYYREARNDKNFWQSLSLRALEAVFREDTNLTYKENGKLKFDLLHEVFPRLEDMKRIRLVGPGDTKISIFAEKSEEELFDNQIRRTVEQRVPILNQVVAEREKSRELLGEISLGYREGMFQTRITKEIPQIFRHRILEDITLEQMNDLNRLTRWLAPGEKSIAEQFEFYKTMVDSTGEGFIPEELEQHPIDEDLPF